MHVAALSTVDHTDHCCTSVAIPQVQPVANHVVLSSVEVEARGSLAS